MTRLVVTADAAADTTIILSYLRDQAGIAVAQDYGHRFRKAIERLVDLPEIGAPKPGLGAQTRISIVTPFIVIYDYDRKTELVTLLRILHGSRNINSDLLKR